MKRRTKKLLSLLLSLALVVGMIPAFGVTASADDGAPYYIWIAGTWVTDANKNDVLGDGTVSYDPNSATLTLKNAHIKGTVYDNNYTAGIIFDIGGPDAIRINLVGNNEIEGESAKYNSLGILMTGSVTRTLTFFGTGSLIAQSGYAMSGDSFGVYAVGQVIFESGDISAVGYQGSNRRGGILSFSNVNIRGGTVTAESSDPFISTYGIWCNDIRIEGGTATIVGSNYGTDSRACYSEPNLSNYSGTPTVKWSSKYTGEGAVDWDGQSALSAYEVQYVSIMPEETEPTHIVISSTLNVREGPGSEYDRIGGLVKDQKVEVVETQGEWSKIKYGTGYGWVMSKYLEPIGGQELVNPFVDVYKTDEYYDAVLWAYYHEPFITNGIDATHFGPMNTVKRCEAMTFLWRAEGCPEPKTTYNPFVDVPTWQYYYKPIIWAVENGITKGTDDTHFSPDQTLTTAHIITFLYRTKNPGKDGWYADAGMWSFKGYGGWPFGVKTIVDDTTNCPRAYVVMFLQKAKDL